MLQEAEKRKQTLDLTVADRNGNTPLGLALERAGSSIAKQGVDDLDELIKIILRDSHYDTPLDLNSFEAQHIFRLLVGPIKAASCHRIALRVYTRLLTPKGETAIAELGREILRLPDATLSEPLVEQFWKLIEGQDPEFENRWRTLTTACGGGPRTSMQCLMLAAITEASGQELEDLGKKLGPLLSSKELRDNPGSLQMLRGLCELEQFEPAWRKSVEFDDIEDAKHQVVHKLFPNCADAPTLLQAMRYVRVMVGYADAQTLATATTVEPLIEKTKEHFSHYLSLNDQESATILGTLATFRDPAAPLVYISGIATLNDEEVSVKIRALMKEFLLSIEEGTFHDKRYDLTQSKHLTAVFKDRLNLLKEWRKGANENFENFLVNEREKVKTAPVTSRQFLRTQLMEPNCHLFQEATMRKRFPNLIAYLETDDDAVTNRQTIFHGVGDKLKALNTSLKAASKEERKTLSRQKADLIFEELAMTLCEGSQDLEPTPHLIKSLEALEKRAELAKKGSEFGNELKSTIQDLKNRMASSSTNFEGWTIEDTDAPEQLIQLGNEAGGSCQATDRNPEYNKCLPAYLVDGKNRVIVIRDASGRIAARAIFRVLYREKEKVPVLFMEQIYPASASPVLSQSIETMARKRATALGMPLVATGKADKNKETIEDVVVLKSPAPYEYFDAAGGVQPRQSITTFGPCHTIFDPREQQT